MTTSFTTFCIALLAMVTMASAEPPEPWLEALPFEVPPAVLLSSAYAHPVAEDADIAVLLYEEEIELDELHRSRVRSRQIFRVLTSDGVRAWSNLSLSYSPWRQERPTVQARVITPDAVSHGLDPETLVESPFGTLIPNVFSDARLLAGPLPTVSVGSVVEIQTERRDKEPLFDAGIAQWIPLRFATPLSRLRIVIRVPTSLTFRHALFGVPGTELDSTDEDGWTRWSLDLGPIDVLADTEPFLPFSQHAPSLAWSTGRSWAAVAARYAEVVDQRIQRANVGKLVREATRDSESPLDKITAIVTKLQSEVRYTGTEFGESGIVPDLPATTLERRFGDCKDTAALLVAMLRSAGFRADIALLDSGIESEFDLDLPGLGMFDHAIVRVADPEIWIDPTSPYARPGVLPMGVEGRSALIAAPDTTAMTRIPDQTPQGNRTVEHREVFLAERGGANIVETTETSGLQEIDYREYYALAEGEDQRKRLQSYATEFYLSGREVHFRHSDAADLSQPFQLELRIEDAQIAFADPELAVVAITPARLADDLRPYLPPPRASRADRQDDRRSNDFRLPWPYLLEWHYRIHPAPGFAAAPLPPQESMSMGPVTLKQRLALEDDGSVTATLSFDTGPRRWTPQQLEQVVQGLERLEQRGPLYISFEQVGRKLLAGGEVQEALGEFRRLAALHPQEALHRCEIAEVLTAVGLGGAARVEARLAVQLEPENSTALRMLGWVLLHDPVGRFLERGSDPVAAESALRRAVELDPSDARNRSSLATLLRQDALHLEGGSGPRMDEAITEYREIRKASDEPAYDMALAATLLAAGRFEDLGRLVADLPPSPDRNAYWVVSVTALQGVEAGLARAWNLAATADERHALVLAATRWLTQARLYTDSRGLVLGGIPRGKLAPRMAHFVDVLSRTRRHEDMALGDEPGPVGFLKRLTVEIFNRKGNARAYMANIYDQVPELAAELERELREALVGKRSQFEELGASGSDVMLDLVFALADWEVDGDADAGFRCRLRMPVPGNEVSFNFYVIVENDEFRLLTSGQRLWILGFEVLRRLDAGEEASARRVFDWFQKPKSRSNDPLAVAPYRLFWDFDAPNDSDPRLAAAALLLGRPGSRSAVEILEQARETADESEQYKFDIALCAGYGQLGRWDAVLATARRLQQLYPDSSYRWWSELGALSKLQRWSELARVARERLQAEPDDALALRFLADVARRENRRVDRDALLQRMVDTGRAANSDYNNLAWNRVELGRVDAETVRFAERAALRSKNPAASALHTLATVYAEVGRFAEAREQVLRHMSVNRAEEAGPAEWQVYGRIAEGYGEREAAVLYYNRVPAPQDREDDCKPCYLFAQRRIKELETRPEPGPRTGTAPRRP